MSYQIKSTPYFQRMLMKSKQNGELQMLKEEYERMNILNERKIEMRMREVRLTRLKREIAEALKCNLKRRRLDSNQTRNTKEAERLENIKKARNLGIYFSQRNLREAKAAARKNVKPKYMQKKIEEVDSILAKRIKYGNETSNLNLAKINLMRLGKEFKANAEKLSINKNSNSETCFEKEQHLINFFDTNSSNINQKTKRLPMENSMPHKSECIDLQIDQSSNTKSSVLTLSENIHFIDLETLEAPHSENRKRNNDDILSHRHSGKDTKLNRAAEYWQKLAAFVRLNFGDYRSNEEFDHDNNHSSHLNEPFAVLNESNLITQDAISNRHDEIGKEDYESSSETWNNDEYSFNPNDVEFRRYSRTSLNSNSIFSQMHTFLNTSIKLSKLNSE